MKRLLISNFQSLSENGRFLIRTCLASRSNEFSFSFEHVWLFARTRLASRSNTFGFSLERVRLLVRTCFIQRSNTSRLSIKRVHTRSDQFGQRTRYTLCLMGTVYDVPASTDLIIRAFHRSSILLFFVQTFPPFFALRQNLFNWQHDYCTCAIKPKLCSDNRGSYNRVFR